MASKKVVFVRWVLALILVAVLGCAAYFPYRSQQHKIDSLNAQLISLRTQLSDAQKNQLPKTSAPSTSTTTISSSTAYTSVKGVKITVYSPLANTTVASPLSVIGEVPGSWSSEASFPVVLADSTGQEIAHGTAQVLGNWMTDQLVPFSIKLTYTGTPKGSGSLVLQKDNPSGQSGN